MDKKKLARLKRRLSTLRNHLSNIRSIELISLAEALERVRDKRGKEPTYVSTILPYSKPISIPNHPGNLNKYTAGNILDALEQDIFNLEEKTNDEQRRH